jgi:hypothetical protein
MNLARGYQTTKDFAHLAAGRERSQKHLDLFHAGGDDSLQIDGGKH